MSAERIRIRVHSGGELGQVLDRAVEAGGPILVDTGEAVYELDVLSVAERDTATIADEPDTLLNIVGIGASAEPTNIARDKDALLAEALDPRSIR